MDTQRYSLPREDEGVASFIGKIFVDGLSQKELNETYNDASKFYDKVS
jgi:hypothetical protein